MMNERDDEHPDLTSPKNFVVNEPNVGRLASPHAFARSVAVD